MAMISRKMSVDTLKDKLRAMGKPTEPNPLAKTETQKKNSLINRLYIAGAKIDPGTRLSYNQPTDKSGDRGRPKTISSGRIRTCKKLTKDQLNANTHVLERPHICAKRKK